MIRTFTKSSMDICFWIFIILTLFWGTSIQNYFNIKIDEGLIGQCLKLPYLFLYVSLCRRIKYVTLTGIDKSLLLLLLISIFFSVAILHKSASLGMYWQLIVIPLLLSCYLDSVTVHNYLKIRSCIVAFFIVECLIAIYEGFTQTILIDTGDYSLLDRLGDFRARALHGHGLQNSFIVTIIGIGILFSNYSLKIKYVLFLLGCGAIMAFNTRSGFYIYLGAFILHLFYIMISKNNLSSRKRFLIIVISVIASFFLLPFFMSDLGLGSRLFLDSENDGGSAKVRFATFNFLFSQSGLDLIIGLPQNSISSYLRQTGFVAIENSILIILFNSGLIFLILYIYLIYRKLRKLILDKLILLTFCITLFALYNVNNIVATQTPSMLIVFVVIYAFIIPSHKYAN